MAKGCDGRFRAWLGVGVGTAVDKEKCQFLFLNKFIIKKIKKLGINNHLLDQAYFQKAWIRSFEGPAGLQGESSAQFLVREERL